MTTERVLVTGGAGFIGSFLVDRLVERGDRVTILDCLDPQVHPDGRPEYLNREAEFIQGDILDWEILKGILGRVEVVYHLAAAVGVGQSQYQVDHYVDVNTHGTARLLDVLVNEKHSVRKIVVAASMSSYGEGLYECLKHGKLRPGLRPTSQMERGEWEPVCSHCSQPLRPIPTPETERFESNSIYAMTKAHQEEMTLNMGRTYGIPAVATRFFNVYGPRQSLSNPYTGVAAIFMSRIRNDNAPVVYEDGGQTRDFISVHDVVDALVSIKESPDLDYESVNVGTGFPIEIREVARTIARVCEKDIEPDIQHKYRKGDVRHCHADMTKLREKLGWSPRVSYEDGIRELVAWSETARAVDGFEKAAEELRAKGLV